MPGGCLPDCALGSASRQLAERASSAASLAAADLEEIADYIARDNPIRAATFVAELEAKCHAVAEMPELYPARPGLAPGLRVAVHDRYLVLYRDLPLDDTVRVERVLHGARNLPRLL
jgi:toxin ParE1/3/4